LQFTKDLIALRRRHPVFRRRRYSTGKSAADLRWFTPAGTEMTADNWSDPMARSVALFIDGATDPDVSADGTPMTDDDFLMLVNAWWEPLTFIVPDELSVRRWDMVCDSFDPSRTGSAGRQLKVGPRSTVVLRSPR
jgi:glycogen operon protein